MLGLRKGHVVASAHAEVVYVPRGVAKLDAILHLARFGGVAPKGHLRHELGALKAGDTPLRLRCMKICYAFRATETMRTLCLALHLLPVLHVYNLDPSRQPSWIHGSSETKSFTGDSNRREPLYLRIFISS
jgi:hypothetical protein